MGEENTVENLPAGVGLAAQGQRLEKQVRMLEDLLERVSLMMNVERPIREQMQVAELMGRTALRLGVMIRTQKQVAFLIFEEEERERKRKEEEERWAYSQRRMAADERMSEASLEEVHKTAQAKRAQIAREMGADPAECEVLYGEEWDPAKIHWK